jgi:hypothetical protein
MMTRSKRIMNMLGSGMAMVLIMLMATPGITSAQNNWMYFNDSEIEAEFNDRFSHSEVEYSMTTQTGTVDLGIDGDFIIIQFSDLFFENLESDIMEGDEEYDFVKSLKTAISSGVTDLLDRGLFIPVSEIASAEYDSGRLVIVDHQNEEIFKELEVDDVYVMEDFRGRDARRFVNRLNRKIDG